MNPNDGRYLAKFAFKNDDVDSWWWWCMMVMVMRKVKRNIFSAKFAFGERSLNRSPIANWNHCCSCIEYLQTWWGFREFKLFSWLCVVCWKKYLKKLETKKYLEPKWPQFEFSFDETLLVLAKKPLIFMGRQIRMQKKLIWVVWFLLKVARPSNLANLPSLSKWFLILASCSFSQQFIYIWVETVACWGDSIWPKKRGVEFAGFKFVWKTKSS